MGSKGMVPIYGAEWNWRIIGLGVEVSFGDWRPREWSLHVRILGLLMWVGVEESHAS